MADSVIAFDDASAYENFMARWSRSIGAVFLDWLAVPGSLKWLEIGCGTGVFTKLLLERCSPGAVTAVDSATAQVYQARNALEAQRVDIHVCDAQALPFAENCFDIVASALVINFIPLPSVALAEMRRVCRPGGHVAGYVWDFVGERSSSWPLRRAFCQIGIEPPRIPGADDTAPGALENLFGKAGLEDIAVTSIDVTARFSDFAEYWRSQTPAFTPQGKAVAALNDRDRSRLIEALRTALPPDRDGAITYSARANAIKARRPRQSA